MNELTIMPSSTAAIWAAIAASFAALSSFLIYLTQRRNLLESVRPEMVLTGWTRHARGEGGPEIIAFQTIKNVGRGAAFYVIINCNHTVANKPTAGLTTTHLPILAANEDNQVDGEILVWWKNVTSDEQGHKGLPITIEILSWDARNLRHKTCYKLFASELSPNVGVADPIAPGLMLISRTTITRHVWQLKLSRMAKRIPGVRKLFPNQPSE